MVRAKRKRGRRRTNNLREKKGANNSDGSSDECVGEESYIKPKSKSKKHKKIKVEISESGSEHDNSDVEDVGGKI